MITKQLIWVISWILSYMCLYCIFCVYMHASNIHIVKSCYGLCCLRKDLHIHSFKQTNQTFLFTVEKVPSAHTFAHSVLTLVTEKAPHIPTPWVCVCVTLITARCGWRIGCKKQKILSLSTWVSISLFHMHTLPSSFSVFSLISLLCLLSLPLLSLSVVLPELVLPSSTLFSPTSLSLHLPVCASRWPCDPVSFCARRTKEPFEVQELPRGKGRI